MAKETGATLEIASDLINGDAGTMDGVYLPSAIEVVEVISFVSPAPPKEIFPILGSSLVEALFRPKVIVRKSVVKR